MQADFSIQSHIRLYVRGSYLHVVDSAKDGCRIWSLEQMNGYCLSV